MPLDKYTAHCEEQIAEWAEMGIALTSADPDAVDRYEAGRYDAMSGYRDRRLAAVRKDDPSRAAELRDLWLAERRTKLGGHSGEYGSLIIHSKETGTPRVVYGNVANDGLIDNLPDGCCVELPCLVDKNGVQPTHVGSLPPQLAALMQTNVNVQALTVEAALTGKRDHVYQAALLDPHTAAELSSDQIVAMVDELIDAHGARLPPSA